MSQLITISPSPHAQTPVTVTKLMTHVIIALLPAVALALYCFGIGAAIVIWGALFKILHLPGGSTLLCIGMGTEIAMFILTAFDRPPKEYGMGRGVPRP